MMILLILAIYFPTETRDINDKIFSKWMTIVFTAAIVFGSAVKVFWRHRMRWTFWAEMSVLILTHFIMLRRIRFLMEDKWWLFFLLALPELAAVIFLLRLSFDPNTGPPSERPAG
jgi:predicted membrane channel-forming protein YqfA (hemolysin III family)